MALFWQDEHKKYLEKHNRGQKEFRAGGQSKLCRISKPLMMVVQPDRIMYAGIIKYSVALGDS